MFMHFPFCTFNKNNIYTIQFQLQLIIRLYLDIYNMMRNSMTKLICTYYNDVHQSKREQVNISYRKIVKLRIRADYYDDI